MSDTEPPSFGEPSFGELFVEALAKVVKYHAAIERVHALHRPGTRTGGVLKWCIECGKLWSCPTDRAVTGDQPPEATTPADGTPP